MNGPVTPRGTQRARRGSSPRSGVPCAVLRMVNGRHAWSWAPVMEWLQPSPRATSSLPRVQVPPGAAGVSQYPQMCLGFLFSIFGLHGFLLLECPCLPPQALTSLPGPGFWCPAASVTGVPGAALGPDVPLSTVSLTLFFVPWLSLWHTSPVSSSLPSPAPRLARVCPSHPREGPTPSPPSPMCLQQCWSPKKVHPPVWLWVEHSWGRWWTDCLE